MRWLRTGRDEEDCDGLRSLLWDWSKTSRVDCIDIDGGIKSLIPRSKDGKIIGL